MSLQVGKVIYKILTDDEDVNQLVQNKVFPLVAENGTTFPFIVYKRNSLIPVTTKDKYIYSLESSFEITVADNTYNGSVDLAEKVINALANKQGKINNVNISSIELTDCSEDFNEDTYIQTINFNIKIN
ncbi:MAG: DUF3168 domain-containing protein [Clostridia bacterium]|nr:DUF3168 domain-containing protein [Clostridia bacterium]